MKYITTCSSLLSILLGASVTQAQIQPDAALGVDRSVINGTQIQGGAKRGANLFHSFSKFSISDAQRFDFANPAGVNNILLRVTDAPSNINGTLGVLGNANLFFMNPNGIYFGEKARLDMAGTFIGSTAQGIKFSDGTLYSTNALQAPLLTMAVPVGLQFGSKVSNINLESSSKLLANDGITSYKGTSLVLVGGDIKLSNTILSLPEGKFELAAIGSGGAANIDASKIADPHALSVIIPSNQARADITIKDTSRLRTIGNISGDVSLQARNIEISGTADTVDPRSVINARSQGQAINRQGGNVTLDATNDVVIQGDFTGISTSLVDDSNVNGGDIVINAKNLHILDGAYLQTSTESQTSGNGGNIFLNILGTLELGAPRNGQESDIAASALGTGKKGNNITIKTGRLIQQDGAQIFTDNSEGVNSLATGKLGSISIVANQSVEVIGVSPVVTLLGFPKPTGITSFTNNKKDAGNIEIMTPKFSLKDGASISAGTDGTGAGSEISITGLDGKNADRVELLGNSNLGKVLGTENITIFAGVGNASRIRSITGLQANGGKAGSITIKANRLALQGGTRIDTRTLGDGDGGSIAIEAQSVELTTGGQLISTAGGTGQAGKIRVQADQVLTLDGIDSTFEAKRVFLSFIAVLGDEPAARTAMRDFLQNPNDTSQKSVFKYWQQANNNELDRNILQQYFVLLHNDPAARNVFKDFIDKTNNDMPFGQKNYNILLAVGNKSAIVSQSLADSTGSSGNITMISPTINISNGAAVVANSDGKGLGGSITTTTARLNLNHGFVTAKTLSTNGGDIEFTINKQLVLRNQSEISASAATNGNGGNVRITSPDGVILAVPKENSDITASAVGGQGGKVDVNVNNVLGFSTQRIDQFSNIAATSTSGPQGIVTITTLGNDPNKGLEPEPITPGAPNLSQACPSNSDRSTSRLIDSGRGGVVPSASESLHSKNLWSDPGSTNVTTNGPPPSSAPAITEAKGWVVGRNRTVVLTNLPTNSIDSVAQARATNCYGY